MTPQEALRLLRSREEMGSLADDGLCLYIGAWEYDADDWTAGGAAWSQGLSQDLKPGVPFAQCMVKEELGERHELVRSLRWLYIGEVGSGTSAHADPLASHGWMWLAAGRKDWRFVNWKARGARQRCEAVPEGAPKDLFESSSCPELASWLQKNEAAHEAWFGELNTGELIFVPSAILHSVRNRGTRSSIAVSHNFVDSTCVDAVLECLQQALSMLLEEAPQLGTQQREAYLKV
ncbi:psr-1, partial [Symbiodinium sp. CCMP2456]